MERFIAYTARTAPTRGARAALREMQRKRGFLPRIYATLAQCEPGLRAYMALTDQFANTTLTSVERQVIMLDVNRFNIAPYCMASHSAIAHAIGMPPEWLAAVRAGLPIPDRRIEALRRFVDVLLVQRGDATADQWNAFLAAGYTTEQALEVVLGLSIKTLSNLVSRLAQLPVDVGHGPFAWPQAETTDGKA
jgi:alkylhydroperoxidase family enzyme